MDRFYYDIVAAPDAQDGVADVRALIEQHAVLHEVSEPWTRANRPAQADLYALLVIASDGLASDPISRAKVGYASAGGFPLIPVVPDLTTYDFGRAPLPELAERNAESLKDPARLLSSLLHHAGLELFEGGGRVFISYARADGSELAEAVRDALHAARIGSTVDLHAFPGGDDIQEDIEREIQASDLVVLIDSAGAARSIWVAEELDIAVAAHVQTIAVSPARDAFHHAFHVPHVPWERGTSTTADVAMNVVRMARRILARKLAFRARVGRTLTRVARLRDWTVSEHGERWRVQLSRDASVTVGCVAAAPQAQDVLRLRTAVQPGRGLLVGGTRNLQPMVEQGLHAVGGSEVTVAPLSSMASRIPSGFAQRSLAGRRVFLSAAMPSEPEDAALASRTLAPFIIGLAQTLVSLGATLVFGGHPSITPLVHRAVAGLLGGDAGHVELHQARSWKGILSTLKADVREGPLFRKAQWHGDGHVPADDVQILRDEMIRADLDAGVFVGGKTSGFIGTKPGIVDEYERFTSIASGKRAFVVGLAAGAALLLPEDETSLGEALRTTADHDLAIALIVAELVGS